MRVETAAIIVIIIFVVIIIVAVIVSSSIIIIIVADCQLRQAERHFNLDSQGALRRMLSIWARVERSKVAVLSKT